MLDGTLELPTKISFIFDKDHNESLAQDELFGSINKVNDLTKKKIMTWHNGELRKIPNLQEFCAFEHDSPVKSPR